MKTPFTLLAKICLFIILALITVTFTMAQEVDWSITLDKGVEWTRYTPSKILLIGSSDWGLYGVGANNGKLLWSIEDLYNSANVLKGADGKNLKYTKGLIQVLNDESDAEVSDFAIVKYTDNIAMKNFVVLNIRTCEVVISPAKKGMPAQKILTSIKALGSETATFNYGDIGYIPELQAIMLSGN